MTIKLRIILMDIKSWGIGWQTKLPKLQAVKKLFLIALAWEIGRWYCSRKQMLRQFLEFLTLADQTRRDAMNKPQDKSVASGSIRFDDLLVWKPVAMVRELPAEVSMEFMKGFLPGPSILQHIFCWAKQLMWPPEPDPSCIGISVFELAINFTISTGINMPRVIRGTGKHPRYIDPWLQPEALLMPTQTWELAKVMEMASGYFARFGDIHIFPTEMYKRCKFLRFLGHYSLVRGFKTRPILPDTERHLMFMQKVVSTEGLTFPTLTPSELSQSRVKTELDDVCYEDRVFFLRKMERTKCK